MNEPPDLPGLVAQLRELGILEFEGLGVKIKLGPPAQPQVESRPIKLVDAPEVCKCGCPTYNHVDGLCLEGCDSKICLAEESEKRVDG